MQDASTPPGQPRPPSPSPAKGQRLKDRMADVARQGPPASRARVWLWVVFGGAALVAGLAQVFGLVESPVARRVLEQRRAEDARKTAAKPAEAERAGETEVVLEDPGPRRDRVADLVREALGLTAAEAKAVVDGAPRAIGPKRPRAEAESLARRLEALGARVTLR